MKHGRIAALLCAALMIFCGCKAKSDGPVAQSENFTFSREMTLYQLYCDKLAMGTSMAAESISAQSLAEYTADNIDALMLRRYENKKLLRAGKHPKGSPKRTKEQDVRFADTLEKILSKNY